MHPAALCLAAMVPAFTDQLALACLYPAAWCRTTLPNLQELQLAKATTQPPHGNSLLQQLVAGASGALQRLSLQGAEFGCGLSMLAAATALTWLDLSGTCVSDHHLEDVALLPLDWLSLADTSVGDEGVAQLLASPLHHLDLK